jgi:hypothetical protein
MKIYEHSKEPLIYTSQALHINYVHSGRVICSRYSLNLLCENQRDFTTKYSRMFMNKLNIYDHA